MKFNTITCVDLDNGIGKDDEIPWYLPEDLDRFRKLTLNNIVIMGRVTAESLQMPLRDRINIVISKEFNHGGFITFRTIKDCVEYLKTLDQTKDVFFIGGEQIYLESMEIVDTIYLTQITNKRYHCDRFFPELNKNNWILVDKSETISRDDIRFRFLSFRSKLKNISEEGYLTLLKKILDKGDLRQTRNAETKSLFGETLKFDLSKGFPLLTTKKIFWRGVVEELLWFLNGHTNTNLLKEKGINFWNANTTDEFIKNRGLNYLQGDMGPNYGFQWRHYGAEYLGMNEDYTGKGFDQIQYCISLIKNDPYSRRIGFTAWNPIDNEKCTIYPCHSSFVQFYVSNGKLNCSMNQRAIDYVLGLPFNIASYALLTHIIAEITNLKVGELTIFMGDTHIYLSHIEQVKIQLSRRPFLPPKLEILGNPKEISDFKFESFKLIDYLHHPTIKAEMIA